MELHLTDKVVVITGGGTGIGRAAAFAYAKEGCKLALCGRRTEPLEAVAEELTALGHEVMVESVDVRDLPAFEAFADHVAERFGRIDIWVNNAGINIAKPFYDYTEADWNAVVDTVLKGVFFGIRFAGAHMRQRGGGVILNVSSFSAKIPNAGRAIYSAAKSGVSSLTRSAAAEYAPFGIRVVGIVPGMIETEISRENISKNRALLQMDSASQRLGVPEDLAQPMVFLASDACGYITGVDIEISGGKFCVQKPQFPWETAGIQPKR